MYALNYKSAKKQPKLRLKLKKKRYSNKYRYTVQKNLTLQYIHRNQPPFSNSRLNKNEFFCLSYLYIYNVVFQVFHYVHCTEKSNTHTNSQWTLFKTGILEINKKQSALN